MTQLLIDKINEVASDLKNQFGGNPQDVPDWAISDKLNELTLILQSVYKPVQIREIKTILILAQELYGIVDYITNGQDRALKSVCFSAMTVLDEMGLEFLDLNNPVFLANFQQIINTLLEADLISDSTKTQIESLIVLEEKQVLGESWAQLNGVEINPRMIGILRGGVS
ncbi:hypothetical protein [Microcystis aeruginosa]|uniref:Uncharacterized protein n=1 Tax=Microcystis aeruginosa NIES-2521 TaxID=2303983 RepID=A0A5A5S931_MICAE|nr:hypothetical protein [Microcystis aeruginosa]GCA81882.1 hypothetical protein MiTs_03901 [Microcystis aeruginosa NIES-2521]